MGSLTIFLYDVNIISVSQTPSPNPISWGWGGGILFYNHAFLLSYAFTLACVHISLITFTLNTSFYSERYHRFRSSSCLFLFKGHCGGNRMIVGFIATYAISA